MLERDRGQDFVPAPRQRAQHPRGVAPVQRFREDSAVERDRRVGGEHRSARQVALHERGPSGLGLHFRHALHIGCGRFARERVLVHVRFTARFRAKQEQAIAHADLREQLTPARAARGEIDAAIEQADHQERF